MCDYDSDIASWRSVSDAYRRLAQKARPVAEIRTIGFVGGNVMMAAHDDFETGDPVVMER